MEPVEENIRQSDVTFWGTVAFVCGVLAILCANLGGLLPENLMTGLHATRLQGGSLNALRAEVSQLKSEATRMRNDSRRMMTMLTVAEKDQGLVVRRIGALESALPNLFEPAESATIDNGLVTAAIGEDDGMVTVDAEGGTVKIKRSPLQQDKALSEPVMPAVPEAQSEMAPESVTPRVVGETLMAPAPQMATAFGLALGPEVTLRDALLAWKDLNNKAGPLLLGLEPRISGDTATDEWRLIAGPVTTYSQAEKICGRMIRIGIRCLPVPYAGAPLPE